MTNDSADMANADGTATDGRGDGPPNSNKYPTPRAAAQAARAASLAAKRKSAGEVIDAFAKPGRELRRIEGRKDFLAYYTNDEESAPLPSNAVDELREVPVLDEPVIPTGNDNNETSSNNSGELIEAADTVKKKMLVGRLAWLEWFRQRVGIGRRGRSRFSRLFDPFRKGRDFDWSLSNVAPIAASIVGPLAFVTGLTYAVLSSQAIDRLTGANSANNATAKSHSPAALQASAPAQAASPLGAQVALSGAQPMAMESAGGVNANMHNAANEPNAPSANDANGASGAAHATTPAPATTQAAASPPAPTVAQTAAGVRTNDGRASSTSTSTKTPAQTLVKAPTGSPMGSTSRRVHNASKHSAPNPSFDDNVVEPRSNDIIREF
jgi:hypothetical protein